MTILLLFLIIIYFLGAYEWWLIVHQLDWGGRKIPIPGLLIVSALWPLPALILLGVDIHGEWTSRRK